MSHRTNLHFEVYFLCTSHLVLRLNTILTRNSDFTFTYFHILAFLSKKLQYCVINNCFSITYKCREILILSLFILTSVNLNYYFSF